MSTTAKCKIVPSLELASPIQVTSASRLTPAMVLVILLVLIELLPLNEIRWDVVPFLSVEFFIYNCLIWNEFMDHYCSV